MDQYTFFAIAAVVLATARYGTYFYTMYQGRTKPHAFSWLLWGIVAGIGAWAQFDLDGGYSVYVFMFISITCFIIFIISLFIGDKDYTKNDWVALILCFIAILLWQVTSNPVVALILIMLIDVLTYWPTLRKSFYKPDSEPPISCCFAGIRDFLIVISVSDPTWQNMMYPLFLMIATWGFVLYIVIRRWQMGYPLHEYSRSK